MQPQSLLALLLGGAIAAGGILQGIQWRQTSDGQAGEELTARVAELESQVELLSRENESLRSLAQGGGEVNVRPELIHFVETAVGLDFQSNPVVHRIASEELRDRVTASIESRFPPNTLDHRQQAWVLMGLLTPDDRFAPQLAATRSIGARSWFDDRSGEGWVTQRYDEQNVADQAALIRVLARVLLHQRFPPPPSYPGDEADRARQALHHGTAIAVENRFLARQALGIGFTGSQVASDAADLLNSLPEFIQGLATFPSTRGTPLAERLMATDKLTGVLHDPPRHTSAFFPDPGPAGPDPTPAPDALLQESLGMLGLELWLRTLDPELAPLATSWRSDSYQLTAREDSRYDLVWTLKLSDQAKADEVLALALAMTGALAESPEDPEAGQIVTSPSGRRLSTERSAPDTILFRNRAGD